MKPRVELAVFAAQAALLLAVMARPAAAYIGPGGGLSLLPTALAMLAAFSVSAVVVITWPVRAARRWLQRRREGKAAKASHAKDHTAEQR
jgi:hypothetical protein